MSLKNPLKHLLQDKEIGGTGHTRQERRSPLVNSQVWTNTPSASVKWPQSPHIGSFPSSAPSSSPIPTPVFSKSLPRGWPQVNEVELTQFTERSPYFPVFMASLYYISYFKCIHFFKNAKSFEKVTFYHFYRQITLYFSKASRSQCTTFKTEEHRKDHPLHHPPGLPKVQGPHGERQWSDAAHGVPPTSTSTSEVPSPRMRPPTAAWLSHLSGSRCC